MATDYIVFIHGFNPHEGRFQPSYADELFGLIQNASESSSRNLKKVVLYWEDVAREEEQILLREYQQSPVWRDFWFRELRENQLLHYTSSAAVYTSHHVGGKVVESLRQQMLLAGLLELQSEDRLHLVAHGISMCILLDILFAPRWDQQGLPSYDSVSAIRAAVYGVEPRWQQGLLLASISTMGCPLGFFSLMVVDSRERIQVNTSGGVINSHDFTPRLRHFLARHQERLGIRLLWQNFAHPGDLMASPLFPLLPHMLDGEEKYLAVRDVIIPSVDLSEVKMQSSNQALFTLLYSGLAHISYWKSAVVAQTIARTIRDQVKAAR